MGNPGSGLVWECQPELQVGGKKLKLDPFLRGFCAVVLWVGALAVATPSQRAHARPQAEPSTQPQTLLLDEARTVYLGNLKRREHGLPPIKWNKQLTEAARWFGWDSVANRPAGYCEHTDTQNRVPLTRTQNFGYKGLSGAENVFCGGVQFMTPEQAIAAWMNSDGHRGNILDPNTQEIGVGFYRDGDRGYAVQDFGRDESFTPLIINDEAITTTNSQVSLYLHNRANDRIEGPGKTISMMVSNDVSFSGANWEPYTAEKTWDLAAGNGWRTVYVKTRDALSRGAIISDTIYVGEEPDWAAIGDGAMSTNQASADLNNIGSPGWNQVQFSPGWVIDSVTNLQVFYGASNVRTDNSSWGGSAICLNGGGAEAAGRLWTSTFYEDVPMQAYFRVRVSDNSSPNEVLRLQVTGGENVSPMLSVKGTDFASGADYQDFQVPFVFHRTDAQAFLMFEFWRSGNADICVDAVSIFPQPSEIAADKHMTVQPPDGNYRGQVLWGRYANDAGQFTAITEFDPYTNATPPSPAPPVDPQFHLYLAALAKN